MDYFKNACRIYTSRIIARYLMSNADGRQNGAEKALRHRELCQFYQAVHTATQSLTDYLDEEIGFPLTGRPDYEALEPLFFEKFHGLAMAALLGVSA